jgi:hypothetical protein
MTNAAPNNLIGAWKRESFQMPGKEACETSRVVWLQTPNRYADVRVSLPDHEEQTLSFGGTIYWESPQLTFNHCIDLKNDDVDVAVISWDSDVLIEDASFEDNGKMVSMKGRWVRQTDYDPLAVAMELRNSNQSLKGLAIKIGDHAIVIIEVDAVNSACFKYINRAWVKKWGVGVTPTFEFPNQPETGYHYQINQLNWKCVDSTNL